MASNPARLVLACGGAPLDVGAPHHEPDGRRATAGTLLVTDDVDPAELLVRDAAGGWRLHPTLAWAWLRPLAAAERPAGEARLAAAWDGLRRWRALPTAELAAVEGLCALHTRNAAEVSGLLTRVAAAGEPQGLSAVPPATAPPAPVPALDGPQEVADFVMDPDGLGRNYGVRFRPRREQADLAAAVARALASGEALLAEAGTGTGKTLAYLVPLLALLQAGEDRAVISTYSRTLQQQILQGDLPRLLDASHAVGARLLMGRGNYLCLRQRQAYLTRPLESGREALKIVALRLWLAATDDGLREELASHPLLAEDCGELFSAVQPCTPHCHEDDRCFVARARRLARRARLVVVNHALLLHDHAAGHALIGPYRHLVVDEAHRLPAAALDARAVALYLGRLLDIEQVVGQVRATGEPPEACALLEPALAAVPGGEAAAAAAGVFGHAAGRAMRHFGQWWREAGRRLEVPPNAVPGQRVRLADKEVAFAPVREETLALQASLAEAAGAAATLAQRTETLDDLGPGATDLLVRCVQAGQLLRVLEQDVRFVTTDPSDRWVTWLDPATRGGVGALGATPLESGPLLRELWQDTDVAPVATSATLAVGGDFGFMLEELGLQGRHPRTATVAVPSPFRWDEQASCLAPERIPDPDQPGFADAVADVIGDLHREAPRQTLVLFTAYRLLQDVADRLADVPDLDLLVQSPRAAVDRLRERFRTSRQAVLLGTSSFWEGVDFPGEALEIVVVTKLPFLVPSDPWVQARCERLRAAGEDPFERFMLRDAVLRLRQGVGRLLRRRQDRGVIVLLDNRLITRRYGATFRDALPTAVRWVPHHRALAAAVRDALNGTAEGTQA
ncbi:MAG: helicase C-terminal domain-containing protein [Candidatus Krumholzibacteriia bacterium]